MAELNRDAVVYAFKQHFTELNGTIADVLYEDEDDLVLELEESDIDNFINDYEDYERDSWLTTQE